MPAAFASAQTLDIGPTETPAGAGIAIADARLDLQDELDAIARATGAGETTAEATARAAVRRYALLMLPAPGDPEPPPSLPLLGRTMWRLAPQLDAAIAAAPRSAAEHVTLLLSRAPAPLSAAEAELALRDALAPIVQQAGLESPLAGWFDILPAARPGGALAAPLTEHLETLDVRSADAATIEQLTALENLLHEADQWRAYRRSAAAIRARIRLAAGALAVDEPWVDEVTRAALADAWADAARRLADDSQDAALQLDLLHGVAAALDLLEVAAALEGGRWDRTRAAVDTAIAHDPTMRARRLHDAAKILAYVGGVAASSATATERDVVRQLRPAWRALARQQQDALDNIAAVAPDLLGGGRAVTDPGALAALATLAQAEQDVDNLLLISAAITDPELPDGREPQVHREHRLAAARLLRHGQSLQSGEGTDAALAELRQFGVRLRARRNAPTADWLAQQPEPVRQVWQTMAGGRAAELLAVDADLMNTWLRIWPDTNDATRLRDLAQRMRAHELLTPLLADLAEVARIAEGAADPSAEPTDALRAPAPGLAALWPGWELSPVALDALLARAEARLAEAVAMALDRRGAGPAERAAALRDDLAPLRLLAALERSLATTDAPQGPPLDELTLGPPLPGSHLAFGAAPVRDALAAAALALEDWALTPEADEALWTRATTLARAALREAF